MLNESRDQKELLNKLLKHVLGTQKFNLTKKWQLILFMFGGGGLFYASIRRKKQLLQVIKLVEDDY